MLSVLNQKIDTLQKIMDERQAASSKALEIYTAEIHRRLELLNGEKEARRALEGTFFPREVAEKSLVELQKAINDLEKRFALQIGRSQILTVVVSSLTSLIAGLLMIIFTKIIH